MYFLKTLLAATAALSSIVTAAPVQSSGSTLETRASATVGRRVVDDGGGIYMRAAHLQDGSIIAAYAWGGGADHQLRVVKTTNEGASWSVIGTIASGDSNLHDIDNVNLIQLPNGRILAAFRNHDRQSSSGPYTWYRITVCYSDDGGATWHFLSQALEHAAGNNNGIWEPFLRVANNGQVQLYYSLETENFQNNADQDNQMRTSSDGGATWSNWIGVSGQGLTSRDGMTGVADLGSGNLM